MNYAYEIFRLFYPERCAACGRSLPEGARLLCPRCRWDMPLTGYSAEHDNPVARKFWGLVPVQEACSMIFFTQGNAYRSMIHGFKYRGQWRTALRLGRWFGTELRESGLYGDVDVVVPVPLHYRRLLSRGYNQAEYFGRGIAEALGVPLDARSVVRSGYNRLAGQNGRSQRTLGQREGHFLGSSPRIARRPPSLARGRRADYRSYARGLRPKRFVGTAPACRVSMATLAVSLTSFSAGKARAACRRFAHRDFVGRSAGGFLFFPDAVPGRRNHMSEGTAARMSCNGTAAHTAYSLSR